MHTQYFLGVICVDPSLGKIDKHSLSQQTLMELFIDGFTANKAIICTDIESPAEISKWYMLTFNESDEIIEIHFSSISLKGTVSLQWLPQSVVDVYLDVNKLSGTVDLTCLPDRLEWLCLSFNFFEGTVDLTQLPKSMVTLFLYNNRFRGKADFSQLPESLTNLDISYTKIEGEIYAFHGTICIDETNVTDMRNEAIQ